MFLSCVSTKALRTTGPQLHVIIPLSDDKLLLMHELPSRPTRWPATPTSIPWRCTELVHSFPNPLQRDLAVAVNRDPRGLDRHESPEHAGDLALASWAMKRSIRAGHPASQSDHT